MRKFRIIAPLATILIIGCASTDEYQKNINPNELLFSVAEVSEKEIGDIGLDKIAESLGDDKTNYIPPDASESRVQFLRKYPVTRASEVSYLPLTNLIYNHKVGQVIRLSADLDKRTSGYVKNESGTPIPISGVLKIGAENYLASASLGGVSQGIASGVGGSAAANPALSTASSIGVGIFAGLISGYIDQIQSERALKNIIAKEDFGSRMSAATMSAGMPSALRLSPTGLTTHKEFSKVAPGVVKVIFVVVGEKNIRHRNRVFILSSVGAYRGEQYKKDYPATEGWEFRITNINQIELRGDTTGEERYREMRNELTTRSIKL